MIVAVIDGMGGGIGSRLVEKLSSEMPSYVEIYALGTNSIATSAMIKNGANKGATGENAIKVSLRKADVIVGPITVVMANSMMGEVTPEIAKAIADSEGYKVLLPIASENTGIVGVEKKPLVLLIEDAVNEIKKQFNIK